MTSGALQDKLPGLIQEAVFGGGRNPDNSTAVVMLWEQPDPLALVPEVGADWLPEGTLTTTISLSATDGSAVHSAPAMTELEMQQTIDEIRDAIALADAKLVDQDDKARLETQLETNRETKKPVPNAVKKPIE